MATGLDVGLWKWARCAIKAIRRLQHAYGFGCAFSVVATGILCEDCLILLLVRPSLRILLGSHRARAPFQAAKLCETRESGGSLKLQIPLPNTQRFRSSLICGIHGFR